jgi:outer membrane biosynthesis protein TonB
MKTCFILMASFLILSGGLATGQQPAANNNPNNTPNNSIFSSDLVMWSYMQEAQPEPGQTRQTPTPDPSPETQPQQNPTAPQQYPPDSPEQSQTSDKSQTSTAQSFTGTVNKEADSFILQVSKTVFYKLDNEQQVQQYEGQRVRVTGTLDTSINLIHVEKVEPLM